MSKALALAKWKDIMFRAHDESEYNRSFFLQRWERSKQHESITMPLNEWIAFGQLLEKEE